jgi:hypothetical protein
MDTTEDMLRLIEVSFLLQKVQLYVTFMVLLRKSWTIASMLIPAKKPLNKGFISCGITFWRMFLV